MRSLFALGVVVLTLVGCKSERSGTPAVTTGTSTPSTGGPVIDAAAPSIDAAAPVDAVAADPEAALRAGRKTGLGAPGEPPEVATEALIVAIADGTVPAAQLIDPARGFVEHRILPGAGEGPGVEVKKQHCGKPAAAALLRYAKELVMEQTRSSEREAETPPGERSHVIRCANQFVATPDPHFGGSGGDEGGGARTGGQAFAYALCQSPGAGEYDAAFELVFTPDAGRGLRAVGMLVWELGAIPDWAAFATDALKAGKVCK